jgi:hypothetical protein
VVLYLDADEARAAVWHGVLEESIERRVITGVAIVAPSWGVLEANSRNLSYSRGPQVACDARCQVEVGVELAE